MRKFKPTENKFSEPSSKMKKTEIGMIPEDWEVKEIQHVVTKLGDGLHGTPKYDDSGAYYFVNGNNLVNGKIKVNKDTKKCSREEFEKYKKELNNRTILVSINGTLGNIAIYNYEKIILGKSACYLTVKEEYNLLFIKYVLKNNKFQNNIQNNATGTTIKNVSLKQMREYKFGIPNNAEKQSAIAKILSDLDSKIELNQQMNKTLEAIGQAIFKHWFVDFEFPNEKGEPYKSSGGEMVESELGKEIPEKWGTGELIKFGKIICGKTPPKSNKEFFNGELPFIKIPDMHNQLFIIHTEDSLTKEGEKYQENKTIPTKSVCVSCIATVGLVSLTSKNSQTNQQINSIIPKEDFFMEYLYFQLKSMNQIFQDYGSGGSTTLNINTTSFSNIKILLPSEDFLKKFHLNIKSIFDKILINQEETNNSSQIRDSLLPRLMSGKIRVPVEVR